MDILLHLNKIVSLIERRRYNRPKVESTKLDSSINLVLMSAGQDVGPPPDGIIIPNEEPVNSFINPFKWFK